MIIYDSLAALHSLPLFFLPRFFANDYNLFQGKLEVINGIAHSQHSHASHALWKIATGSSRKFSDIQEHIPYIVTSSYLFIYFLLIGSYLFFYTLAIVYFFTLKIERKA